MAAAIELARECQLDKIAVADIAEAADVSVATVYNLVGTREKVLTAVLDDYVERIIAAVDADPSPLDPAGAIRHVITTAVDQALADPVPVRRVLCELGPLQFAENRNLGLAALIEPHLDGAAKGDIDPAVLGRLAVYGFRGVLISWAHELIDEATFVADTALTIDRLLGTSPGPATKGPTT